MEQLVAGGSTSRTCAATGNPRPVLSWEKDGVMVMGDEPFLAILSEMLVDEFTVSSTLQIGPAVLEAGGNYTCVANGFNPDDSTTMIFSNTSTIIFICKTLKFA